MNKYVHAYLSMNIFVHERSLTEVVMNRFVHEQVFMNRMVHEHSWVDVIMDRLFMNTIIHEQGRVVHEQVSMGS